MPPATLSPTALIDSDHPAVAAFAGRPPRMARPWSDLYAQDFLADAARENAR